MYHGTCCEHLSLEHLVFALRKHLLASSILLDIAQHYIDVHNGGICLIPCAAQHGRYAVFGIVPIGKGTQILIITALVALLYYIVLSQQIKVAIRKSLAVEIRTRHAIVDTVHCRVKSVLGRELLFLALLVVGLGVKPVGTSAQHCAKRYRQCYYIFIEFHSCAVFRELVIVRTKRCVRMDMTYHAPA